MIGVKDGEVRFQKGEHHRLFPHFGRDGGGEEGEKTVFVLSGEESGEVFQLDTVFFQNWYGYQDRFVSEGRGPSLVQVMSVSFLSLFHDFFLYFSFLFFWLLSLSSAALFSRTPTPSIIMVMVLYFFWGTDV